MFKKSNIKMMGITEREKRKKGTESLLKEIIDENFPYLGKDLNTFKCKTITKHLITSTQKDLLQIHYIETVKS